MAEEVKHNHVPGKTLYFCRFLQSNSNVMLANPATNEVWGTGARDADDSDVQMAEEGGSGHYTGDFASGGSIGAGTYSIAVYNQAGGSPIDSDVVIAQGQIYWSGSTELDLFTILAKLPTNYIMGSSDQTDKDDDIDAILVDTNEIQGKLPTNFIMGSSDQTDKDDDIDAILVDTNEIQGKLPDDFIMGSSVPDSMDDEINAIKANLGQVHTTEDESPGGGGGAPSTTSGIAEGC